MSDYMETLREWLPRALRHHATIDGNWTLRRRDRWWYTAKAIACMLLNREGAPERYADEIEVAAGNDSHWQHPEFGEAGSFDFLAVGPGVRSGWWFRIGYASWP